MKLTKEQVIKNLEDIVRFGGLMMSSKFVESVRIAMEAYINQQDWIPVSEGLPKERGTYIVTEKVFSLNDRKHTGRFDLMTEQVEFCNGKWERASFYEIIAWMPKPEPYKAESEVTE